MQGRVLATGQRGGGAHQNDGVVTGCLAGDSQVSCLRLSFLVTAGDCFFHALLSFLSGGVGNLLRVLGILQLGGGGRVDDQQVLLGCGLDGFEFHFAERAVCLQTTGLIQSSGLPEALRYEHGVIRKVRVFARQDCLQIGGAQRHQVGILVGGLSLVFDGVVNHTGCVTDGGCLNVLNTLDLGGNFLRLGHGGGGLGLVVRAVLCLRRNRVLLIQGLGQRGAQHRVTGQHSRHDQGTHQHGTTGGDGALGRTQCVGERQLAGLGAGDRAEGTYQRRQYQRGEEEDRNTEQQRGPHHEKDGLIAGALTGTLVLSQHNQADTCGTEDQTQDRADLAGLAHLKVGVLAHRANGRDAQGASCRGERRQNRDDGADQGTDNHRGD